eukprot:8608380-Pyramimonas_sp.AAC.1
MKPRVRDFVVPEGDVLVGHGGAQCHGPGHGVKTKPETTRTGQRVREAGLEGGAVLDCAAPCRTATTAGRRSLMPCRTATTGRHMVVGPSGAEGEVVEALVGDFPQTRALDFSAH